MRARTDDTAGSTIFARRALLTDGWATNVRLTVTGGVLGEIAGDARPVDGDLECGIVLPGLCNAHSHAFQRALVGHTESRAAHATDTFWTWRTLMYRLAAALDAELLEAVAAQVYAEMVACGYTSVVEFHYLLGGNTAATSAAVFADALLGAAEQSGIRLIYVPVLYERGDFDEPALNDAQARFALPLDGYLGHYENVRDRLPEPHRIGLGAHSLRAVSPAALREVGEISAREDVPVHLHIAEQQREVDACLATLGARPVEWLLDNLHVDERWTLVHATHIDSDEVSQLAASGATVCACPTTEGNLGDGFFPLREFLTNGGRLAIGSDSHVTINPFEELRWLEYGQRLLSGQRNVAALVDRHTGASLYRRALAGGARAAGRDDGQLRPGAPADLIVLDDSDPLFVGHSDATLLDALVFSGRPPPIERVLVAGRWCVEQGVHAHADTIAANYRRAVAGASQCLQPGAGGTP